MKYLNRTAGDRKQRQREKHAIGRRSSPAAIFSIMWSHFALPVCLAVFGLGLPLASAEDRVATPAVVNPAVRSPLAAVISLRGAWDFAVDPKGRGRDEGWMKPKTSWPGLRQIEVPGCWEAQGVGQPGMSTTWDIHFDCLPCRLRHVYRGSAWYRRAVAVPETWTGKRVWLKIGGVRAQGWFWINGHFVTHVDNYCGTYKYDVTDLVAPGQEAAVVALVRNDVPARKGEIAATNCFGGVYRDVELEATPTTWIDNLWVQGDLDRRDGRRPSDRSQRRRSGVQGAVGCHPRDGTRRPARRAHTPAGRPG